MILFISGLGQWKPERQLLEQLQESRYCVQDLESIQWSIDDSAETPFVAQVCLQMPVAQRGQ
jgi:hypothetical protein